MFNRLILFLLLAGSAAAQQIAPAPEYENLFNRNRGWSGADGTYSYVFRGKDILWSFSDTFFGEVQNGKRSDFELLNNSHILQHGNSLTFLKSPSFTPPTGEGWFWMWDGTFDGEFSVLLGQFAKDKAGIFGFEQIGLWHAKATLHSPTEQLVVQEYTKLPFYERTGSNSYTFGSALVRKGAWDYVFGVSDAGPERRAILARVPHGGLGNAGLWRFYDGNGWSDDPWSAAPLFQEMSMECSVHRTVDGSYVYVGSIGTGGKIVGRRAPKLTGPWSAQFEIYQAPEVEGNIIAYNAKAHPKLSTNKGLLVSYNVNTTDLTRVIEEADIYRPRFFWWYPEDRSLLPLP